MKRLLPFAILGIFFLPLPAAAQRTQSARKYLKHGTQLLEKGDIAGAIGQYDRALAINPKFPEAYLNRGKAKRASGNLDAAIDDFEMAAELAPQLVLNNRDVAQAYLNRGSIKSNRLDLDGALGDYDRAIKLDPNDAEAYFKRGRALLVEGNAEFAIADFDKSISLDDHNPLVYAERGLAHRAKGHDTEAQKDFEHGLKLNNDLRLMIDLHLMDLQMQMKEMRRRQALVHRNIA